MAADTTTPNKATNTNTPATQKTPTTNPKGAPTTPAEKSTPAPESSNPPPPASTPAKSTPKNTPKQQSSPDPASSSPAPESSSAAGTVVITPTGGQSPTETASVPTLTTPGTTTLLNLPTLKTTDTAIPAYPAPTVPPTENAPFMQHSNLPDGTVFIAVGAILGGFAAALLVWRAVVAYLLHRSIARAALAQHAANDKAPFAPAAAPFYKYSDRESSLNVGAAGAGSVAGSGRGVRRTNRGPTPSATPSQTNLFFSPTAPGASGMGAGGNRDSRLLPSGFYAAGTASPAGAAQGQAINMSNLRPDSRHGRNIGPSPPDSPNFGPMRTNLAGRNMSGSSVSLNRPASGRAPSAFLDDLLDDQPHLFPPGTGPSHNHSYSQSSHGGSRF
ncbi:hypothetical protein SPBR_06008 [Sporothrix brasiliensis 5110]|uniref:Csi2 protein n=1 Tax=Sporothrix brasiliensis 5110 TaxID=1398154 RepID=A0A0C2IZF8_9PEZI|nr:uncharacterized protein SPBR_06008 [Sporothrix brasiliensis 5110]KIH94496.1 hypothetical protein SPBR_06008 [Sporothrix brasiliensis 5110]